MFSLAYLPSAERLTVVILKARNLRAIKLLEGDKKTSGMYTPMTCQVIKRKQYSLISCTSSPLVYQKTGGYWLIQFKMAFLWSHKSK